MERGTLRSGERFAARNLAYYNSEKVLLDHHKRLLSEEPAITTRATRIAGLSFGSLLQTTVRFRFDSTIIRPTLRRVFFDLFREHTLSADSGFEVVMTYKTWGETYDLLKEEISKDKEGYVIKFKNGFRMKIKGDEYVRLHKILTNISNRDIWEYLKDNKPFDELLEKVPDEFNDWVKTTIRDLKYACYQLRERAGKLHDGKGFGKEKNQWR